MLPRDVGIRRDAVLSLADARAALAEGDTARGNEAALQANKLAPMLVPAAALAARVHAERGQKRKAIKILTTAWAAHPNPELAAAFAAIEPDESPDARRKRFATLVAANPANPESRLLEAELALAAEDFPGARKALGDLAVAEPTTRSLALMAAIERGSGEFGRRRARLARQGARRLARAAVDLHQVQPRQRHLGSGLRELRRLRHPRLAHAVARRGLAPRRLGDAAAHHRWPPPRRRSPGPAPAYPASPPKPESVRPASEIEDAELASAADQARAAGGA